jgi:hypothetical protein
MSGALAMVSIDDGNHIVNAFWLPAGAPLILVLPPKRTRYSPAVGRLLASERKIIPVGGEVGGAVSQNATLFAKCVGGELDANSRECDPAYAGLVYNVSAEHIIQALQKGIQS